MGRILIVSFVPNLLISTLLLLTVKEESTSVNRSNVGDLSQTTKPQKNLGMKIDTCVAKTTNRVIIDNRTIAKQHHSNNKTTITRTQQINSPGKCR